MKIKKIIIILLFITITFYNIPCKEINPRNINFLPGSNIYVRIFLFYFAMSKNYDIYFNVENNKLNINITITKDNIKKEPSTPEYFESDIIFHIKDIPFIESGYFKSPVSIQCNKRFIKKKIKFTIYRNDNILILKGALTKLLIEEITENEYFKKRFKWKYPLYFDLRLQLD